ncbi:aspartyl protease [Roseimicrobium gellanilyticum]|uniref:Aspartyl protease n=1 Tax=Roseimicrobium gellanilyticum TaxID=748857 RepID=A0A366HLV0_9BACT|nr:retropepsin-like aspartic protease [Roseimicrobium gellanilyticum]RBP43854.1 aspartyl protease [Roseimicrobium gellanilyticum]
MLRLPSLHSLVPRLTTLAAALLLGISATTALANANASSHSGIPIEIRDGLIWVKVQAQVAGQTRPLNFLLDSGAGCSVLSANVAEKLGMKYGRTEKVRRVETTTTARRVRDFQASIGGIPVSETPLALDLTDVSELCSRPVDGLLGHDFFQGRIIQIDFQASRLRILEETAPTDATTVLRMKVGQGAMLVPVSVNGSEPKWTRLDTGCDDGLHWVAGRDESYVSTSVRLGDEQLRGVKTALHAGEIFPKEAGMLGVGILRNYRVTIDAVNRQLILEKRSS